VWVAGIALVLMLLLGVVVSLLWPEPRCEAGRVASQIRIGMMYTDAVAVMDLNKSNQSIDRGDHKTFAYRCFKDDSTIIVNWDLSGRISWVRAGLPRPNPPVHPLTRLRRTLARALRFLAE
jgi:hypothetical protein